MLEPIKVQLVKSELGELIIGEIDDQICMADHRYRKLRRQIDSRVQQLSGRQFTEGTSPIIEECLAQINAYALGELREFQLPIKFIGSDFQISVWEQLLKIPYGEIRSYAQLANAIGSPNAVRAFGSANGANAISFIVPCHRVIGQNHQLTGYAGGLSLKKRLLLLENNLFNLGMF